ncbi:hypothetical protein D3C85_1048330 [compost metagenome]
MPASLLAVIDSPKHRPPMRTPINGVVALKIAEYPAGKTWAATEYRAAGMPELIMPSSRAVLNLPRKFQSMRINARIISKPAAAIDTRKNAVGTAPITGAMMRMNRKLAPQMAASSSIWTTAVRLTIVSRSWAGRECCRVGGGKQSVCCG